MLKYVDEFGDRILFKGTEAEGHFVGDDSQTPDICFDGVNLSFENFWGHVNGWSEHGLGQISLTFETFAEPEVS